MSRGKPIVHPLTSQLDYEYILGPVKIKDGLFIGDEFAAKDIEFIHTNKVTHVINTVSRRIPNIWEKVGVQYLSFNWSDTDWNIFDKKNTVLQSIFAFIEQAMDLGECCLVHSLNSKSRSFVVVAAYLMKKYSWSLDKIFSFMNSKKPGIQVKGVFMKQLRELQDRLNKIHTFNMGWDQAKNQQDLILKNTYINSFPIQFSQVHRKDKTHKKVTWIQAEYKGNRYKEERKRVSQQYGKEEQPKTKSAIKPILKGSNKGRQILKSDEDQPNIINNINGNVIHLTVNNFITPDQESKTATKTTNPAMTRPYSSDTKDKKKEPAIRQRPNPYDSFLNFKSPYQGKQPGQKIKRPAFGSKVGMNLATNSAAFKNSQDTFKNTYQRPLSAANQDKKKLKGSQINPTIKDLVVTNSTRKPLIGGRYPSPMVKDSGISIGQQLRDRWRRDI